MCSVHICCMLYVCMYQGNEDNERADGLARKQSDMRGQQGTLSLRVFLFV